MILPFSAVSLAEEPAKIASSDPLTAAMDACADGEDTFGRVYDLLKPRLYAFLTRQTKSQALAEDLLQETFIRMYDARASFVRGADVVPWAFAIARRLLIDAHRRAKCDPLGAGAALDPELLDMRRDATPHDSALLEEAVARLRRELADIPESHRAAFEMIRCDGLSVAQTAEVLGVSVSATKVRAHRVYERLRDVLAELGWETRAA